MAQRVRRTAEQIVADFIKDHGLGKADITVAEKIVEAAGKEEHLHLAFHIWKKNHKPARPLALSEVKSNLSEKKAKMLEALLAEAAANKANKAG